MACQPCTHCVFTSAAISATHVDSAASLMTNGIDGAQRWSISPEPRRFCVLAIRIEPEMAEACRKFEPRGTPFRNSLHTLLFRIGERGLRAQ